MRVVWDLWGHEWVHDLNLNSGEKGTKSKTKLRGALAARLFAWWSWWHRHFQPTSNLLQTTSSLLSGHVFHLFDERWERAFADESTLSINFKPPTLIFYLSYANGDFTCEALACLCSNRLVCEACDIIYATRLPSVLSTMSKIRDDGFLGEAVVYKKGR